MNPPFERGELVVCYIGNKYVGRVVDCRFNFRAPLSMEYSPSINTGTVAAQRRQAKNWMVKIKPIHETPNRKMGKARWCQARNWRRLHPLEALALQAEDD